jgi:hypothetical protein
MFERELVDVISNRELYQSVKKETAYLYMQCSPFRSGGILPVPRPMLELYGVETKINNITNESNNFAALGLHISRTFQHAASS